MADAAVAAVAGYDLHLYVDGDQHPDIGKKLMERAVEYTAQDYLARRDSGFDLEVYQTSESTGGLEGTNIRMFDTCVIAKVKCRYTHPTNNTHREYCPFWLCPRSSLPTKLGYMMVNSVGVIDQAYWGTLKVPLMPISLVCNVDGKRAVQVVSQNMEPFLNVHVHLEQPTARAADRGGGFGSTGHK